MSTGPRVLCIVELAGLNEKTAISVILFWLILDKIDRKAPRNIQNVSYMQVLSLARQWKVLLICILLLPKLLAEIFRLFFD